jgi:riboflavin biosynthesis pyrimidine reductase
VKGDEFKDLDLLAKLLAPTSVVGGDAKDAKLKKRSLIEVLESKDVSEPEMKTEEEHLADGMEKLRLEREIFLEGGYNLSSTIFCSVLTR